MRKVLFACVLAFSTSAIGMIAQAKELDDERGVVNVQNPDQGTVILRVDTRNNSSAVLNVDREISSRAEALKVVKDKAKQFKALPKNKVRSELDEDGGASSWFFYIGIGLRRDHNRGYDQGYDRGYNRGYDRGYDRRYDRDYGRDYDGGYDRGYDRDYDRDDYGRYTGRGYVNSAPSYCYYGDYYRPYYSYQQSYYSYYYYGRYNRGGWW